MSQRRAFDRQLLDRVLDANPIRDLLESETGQAFNPAGKLCCPFHDESTPSLGVRERAGKWKCFGCGKSGDALDLVQELRALDWKQALAYLAQRGGVDLPPELASETAAVPAPSPRRQAGQRAARRRQSGPKRLPSRAVREFWTSCQPLTQVKQAREWVASRGLTPGLVEDFDLARALPAGRRGPLPRWARFKGDDGVFRSWRESGHAVVLPLWDERGRLAGLRARDVLGGWPKRKELAPVGQASRGLVFACPFARLVLSGGAVPEEEGESVVDLAGCGAERVLVVEGSPDFLTWATAWGDGDRLGEAPAVVGIYSGAWSPGIAARVPDCWEVVVRYHDDGSGSGLAFAEKVGAAVADRCQVLVAEAGGAGGAGSAP